MRKQFWSIVSGAFLFSSLVLGTSPLSAQARPAQTPAVPAAQKAGSVTALLPVAKVVRGLGRTATTLEAKKGDDLVWNDLVRTEKGGRIRITLTDQSVLSLGSQAELRIVKHDARSQQTALQLGYGRIRAEVAAVTRDGGSFELRTPTAVAGVIGTDFGTDSSLPGVTTFLCLAGTVQVSNSDPGVSGVVPCPAGTTTTVSTGQKPTAPKPITQQQIQQLIQDTEPATISSLSPSSALQGASLQATATGTKMTGINAVSITGSGVNVSLVAGNSDTSTIMNVTVAADAPAGPRTLSFTKSNGQTTAAVFTILAPPSTTSTLDLNALKTAYGAVIEQERQSEVSGINSIGVGVQQSANLGGQQLAQADQPLTPPIDLTQADLELVNDVAPLLNAMGNTGNIANGIAATATSGFSKDVDTAVAAARASTPPPTDDAIKALVKSTFDKDNTALQQAFAQNRSALGSAATTTNNAVNASVTKWLAVIQAAATDQAKGPNIASIVPNQGNQGATVQITIKGDHLAGIKSITSSGNGVTGTPVNGNDSQFNFTLTITPDAAPTQRTLTFTRANNATGTALFSILQVAAPPNPKIDATDRTYDLGVFAQPAFDGSGSSANNGASVVSTNWDLCDPGYRATATGVVLPASDTRCHPINGYSSPQAQFNVQTCNLNSGDYAARLTVTDSNALISKMDSILHILPANYDNPPNRLQNMAQAYASLQPEQFLAFFDSSFAGYTSLAENIRNTLNQLQSMTINLQVSQVSISCNDADIRATWQQKYTFKADQTCANVPSTQTCNKVVFTQNEPLTMHMVRNPGKGWFITSISGDNGTVQGTPPGPVPPTTGPDLIIQTNSLQLSGGGTAIAAGNNTFVATVQNIGTGALSAADGATAGIRFSVTDINHTEIVATQIALPAIAVGGSVQVNGTLIVPNAAPNTPIIVIAEVNHNCVLQTELNCANNTQSLNLTLGSLDLAVSNFRAVGNLIATQQGDIRVDIKNQGLTASVPVTGNLLLKQGTTQIGSANIPVISPNQTVSVDVLYTVPDVLPFGTQTYTVGIAPNSEAGDTNPANDTVTGQVTTLSAIDLSISNLSLSTGLTAFQPGTATVQVTNNGALNYIPGANDKVVLSIGTTQIGSIALPSINAGATVTINNLPFTVPNVGGTTNFSAAISPQPANDVTTTDKITGAFASVTAAQAVLSVTSLAITGHTLPLIGAQALNTGEVFTLQVTVSNTGNFQPTGNFTLSLSCGVTCGTPLTGSAAVPPVGQSVVVNIPSVNFSLSAGSYQETISFSTLPANTVVGTPFPVQTFEVFDFNLSDPVPVNPVQNLPIGGSGTYQIQLNEPGVITPLTLNYSANPPVTSGVTNGATGSLSSGGSATLTVRASVATPPGSMEFITTSVSRFGVTRTAGQQMQFYDTSFTNVTGGQPGSTSGTPIPLLIGGPSYQVQYKLNGTFSTAGGPATIVNTTATGINVNVGANTANPGDVLNLTISAVAGATPNVVTPYTLTFNIPNTVPQQTVSTQIFLLPAAVPDLTITSINPTNAFFTRNFSTNPLLSGEAGDFNIIVGNVGGSPGGTNSTVRVHLGSLTGPIIGQAALGSAIAANGTAIVLVHIDAPDPLPNNAANVLVVEVTPDVNELNTANNSSSIAVATADWSLNVSGAGTNTSPVAITSGNSSSANVVITTGLGSGLGPITLVEGSTSTGVTSPVLPLTMTAPLNRTVGFGVVASAQSGIYAMQVIAQMLDGSVVTARRSTVIYISVNGGTLIDTVSVSSSRGNASATTSCVSTCTPIQINGPLVESTQVTVTRAGGTVGHVDLFLSDDPGVVSNVTTSGQQQLQSINDVNFGIPVPLSVTASESTTGSLVSGPAKVAVSAVNIASNVIRSNPTLPTIGNQQTYLFYNVGDLNAMLTPGNCIQVSSNGGSTNISVTFNPVSGFNSSLTWQWIGLPAGLSVNIPSGSTPFSGGYAPVSFVFTNNNTQDIASAQSLTLQVTVNNGNGSASKFFPVQMYLSNVACGGSSFSAHPASSGGSIFINGTWKTNPGGSGVVAQVTSHSGTLPDLSIHSVDVQISPSIPKHGDIVNVRFKLNNTGDSDAHQVPIALEVNGLVVAMDVFDVAAGRSILGGLNWNSTNWQSPAQGPAGGPSVRPLRNNLTASNLADNNLRTIHNAPFIASLVIDPANTIKEKTNTLRTLMLPQLTLRPTEGELLKLGTFRMSRAVFELAEGCNGVRISSGSITSCASGEVDFNIEDIASSKFSITASTGVADLGSVDAATADTSNVQFTSQVTAVVGHTYAIQLNGSQTAVFTLSAALNPHQLEALSSKRFNGGGGVNIIHQLGGSSSDLTSASRKSVFVYFDLRIRTSQ